MKPRILVVTPAFHGYGESIARGFEANGYDVTVHAYDKLDSVARKMRHKAFRELPAVLGLRHDQGVEAGAETIAAIEAARPNVTIVIRGDSFPEGVHDALSRHGGRRVLWLWDELRRTRHTDETLARFDHHISYSEIDAQQLTESGRPCLHVHNAFDHTQADVAPRHTRQILFVGASYPRRVELLEGLAAEGVPVLAVGRDWSRHWFDRARTWRWSRPELQSMRDVDRLEGYAMTAGAPAAINIHFDQDGFTMKTFEVPGVGGVQLIDRDDVDELYEPGTEVLTFSSVDELAELSRRCISDDSWGDRIREAGRRRTLAEHTFAHRARDVEQLWA